MSKQEMKKPQLSLKEKRKLEQEKAQESSVIKPRKSKGR
ncbi:hypothetical protein EEJ35_06950 [Vibrio cholerae]|nr:hypothetical protein EEJ35_06950 [Vibrio cholerae]